jgi:hypothetical protein
MKRFTVTLLCFLFCTIAHSQINQYVSNTWDDQPHLQSSTDTSSACTLLKYIVVRDFNRPLSSGTHYRTIYKRIRINTLAGADSLAQILIPLEPFEKPFAMFARVINTDSTTTVMKGLRVFMKGTIETIRLTPLNLKPGAEIEYDFTIIESDGYAGFEYMQSTIPCQQATFMLILPPDMLFRTRGSNGFPDVQDSINIKGIHYYHATAYHTPALPPGDLYYYNTWLQRTEFALRDSYWQQPAKDQFLEYVSLENPDYKKLQKEVSKWVFLKNKMSLPDLIYQIEQQIKSEYKLIDDNPDEFAFTDITTILRTKVCNETGMVKLMASIYYLLGVKSQILFASAKETIPLDSAIVNIHLANNILIYFPDLKQALAPASPNTRFPYYPSSWAGTLALRCRDTLIDKKADVLVDFIQTPTTDYTTNNISLEATLNINEKGVNDVYIKQTVGGAPSLTIKTILSDTTESKENLYNSLLPTGQISVTALTHKVQNDNWNQPLVNAPFIIESSFKTDSLNVGMLINGLVQQHVTMPPANIPVEMAYPFYQESRITITVPAGYKMTNVNDYILDVHGVNLGYKILCKQTDNTITIFAVKWYKKNSYSGEEKKVFEKIILADNNMKTKKLHFSHN